VSARKGLPAFVLALVGIVGVAPVAGAGTGQGKVGSFLVGRLGYQVFVQVLSPVFTNFACGTPNPGNWHFAFSTQNPGGKDMLATVLAAKATGATLVFVGSGTCTQDSALEDVSYIIQTS
jgi:hypothetical protein